MKVAIYARVSSDEQTEQNQVAILEKWAIDRGFDIYGIYREQASAWKSGHQAELSRLLLDAKHHQFDRLMVWAIDRLSREGIASILNLINTLGKYKVVVMSYQEGWTEQGGPMLELLYSVTAWAAKYESDRRSERTKAGHARAIMEGKKLGRPAGSKDKRMRKRTGYLLRYAK